MAEQQLDAALAGLLTPDNRVIKQSRAFLIHFLRQPGCVAGLLSRVAPPGHAQASAASQASANPGVRQVAAVLLHKVVNKHWGRLDAASRQLVQTSLLHLLTQEPEPLVRRAIGSVVSRLAKHLLPGWTDMLQLIQACAAQADPQFRAQAMLLLYQSAEPVGDTLDAQFPGLAQLYAAALRDQDVRVRVMALKACAALVAYVSKDKAVLAFQPLVPMMHAVVRECADPRLGEDTAAALGLECFVDLAVSPAPGVLKGHVGRLARFALELGTNRGCDLMLRDAALQVVIVLSEAKPRTIAKLAGSAGAAAAAAGSPGARAGGAGGFVAECVTAMFQMCMEVEGDTPLDLDRGGVDDDEDLDEDDEGADRTPSTVALFCLDRLAIALPNKYVFPVARDAALAGIGSGRPKAVAAALFALGNIAEGCSGALVEALPQLLPLMLPCANHADQRVRGALCHCLSMFATYIDEGLLELDAYVTQILEMVLGLLRSDPRPYTRGKCLYLLEMLCEKTDRAFLTERGYLEPTMTTATAFLNQPLQGFQPPAHTAANAQTPQQRQLELQRQAMDIQRKAIAVICSLAISCGRAFAPYVDRVFAKLRALSDDPHEARITLRGEAIQCIGHLAAAAGPQAFGPAVMDCMQVASRCLQCDDPELHEYVFNFFGSVAECLGPAFKPFLEQLVPLLDDQCLSNDAVEMVANADADLQTSGAGHLGEGDDEDDEDDEGLQYRRRVRVGMMDLKEAAIINLGRIAAACAGYDIDGENNAAEGAAARTGVGVAAGALDPFAPHVPRILSTMKRLLTYFQETIRVKAVGTMRNMTLARWYAVSGGAKHGAGSNGNVPDHVARAPLPESVRQIVAETVPLLILRMNKDQRKSVAASCVEAMDAFVQDMGAPCVCWTAPPASGSQNILGAVVQQLLLFLEGKAACQEMMLSRYNDDGGGGDEDGLGYGGEDDDEEDHDFILMDSVTDLIGSLSRAIGPQFAPYAVQLLQPLGRFLAPNRPHTDRSMAIGTYGEIVSGVGAALQASPANMLEVGLIGLRDAHHEVQVSFPWSKMVSVCC